MAEVSLWASLARSLGIKTAADRNQQVDLYLANLRHESEDMRRSACWSLGKMRPAPTQVLHALEEVAQHDKSSVVRKAARWAISSITSPQ